ncbi:MAG: hypothetical protein GF355_04905 [Candidatus Eisenbacteria bacterium]|nr:hypothetical protein [Candidatus Eisenbacteria bacterium]
MSGPGDGAGNPEVIWDQSYSGSIFSIAALPSINGDDVNDIATGAWNNQVTCHDGAGGQTLWTAPIGSSVMRISLVGDVNDDATPDLAVASWSPSAFMVSGLDGSILWSTPIGDDCWAIDGVEDVTGDGIPDVVVGSFTRSIYVLDGVDGAVQWSYATNAKFLTVRGTPDLDGNGVPDVIGGTQKLTVGGHIYALQGGEDASAAGDDPYLVLNGAPGLRLRGPLALTANSPNPFRESTRWRLALSQDDVPLVLEIVDAGGRRVRRLSGRSHYDRGVHNIRWDRRSDAGDPASPGVYFLRVLAPGAELGSEKAILVR